MHYHRLMGINQLTAEWCERTLIPVWFLESTPSTNQWAKDAANVDAHPLAAVFADLQTQGRGRNQNKWQNSKAGETLLSTWCLGLAAPPQPIFAIRCGLLLFESLRTAWPELPWAIKAPNDIYIGSGKFAGILIEIEQQSTVKAFIGIGANIFSAPSVTGQETSCLTDFTEFQNDKWFEFCSHFTKGLLELRKDAHRQLLTPKEAAAALEGLQKYGENEIKQLLPDGGLILKNNDRIHWNEL